MVPALEAYAIDNDVRIRFAGASGCPPLLGIQSIRGSLHIEKYNCKELNNRIFNYVKTMGIKNVVLMARWTYYTDSISRPSEFNPVLIDVNRVASKEASTASLLWGIKNTVSKYSSIGVKVVFVEDTPQQKYNPVEILRKGMGSEAEYLKLSVTLDEHLRNQRMVNKALREAGAKTISLDDVLCMGEICPLVSNSKFLYSDDDHLSVDGAKFVSQKFSDRLKR